MDHRIFNVHTGVNPCDCTRGCTDTVRESALKVDSRRKIPCLTGMSNLCRRRAGSVLCQLSYISDPEASARGSVLLRIVQEQMCSYKQCQSHNLTTHIARASILQRRVPESLSVLLNTVPRSVSYCMLFKSQFPTTHSARVSFLQHTVPEQTFCYTEYQNH